MEYFLYLMHFALIFIIGFIAIFTSKKVRINSAFLLVIFGFIISHFSLHAERLIKFPHIFLQYVSVFLIALGVFDASSRLRSRFHHHKSKDIIVCSIMSYSVLLIVTALIAHLVFGISNLFVIIIFALIMTLMNSTEIIEFLVPKDQLSKLKSHSLSRLYGMLRMDYVFSTVISSLLVFSVLEWTYNQSVTPNLTLFFFLKLSPFIIRILLGAGFGVFVGLAFLSRIKKKAKIAPLVIILSVFLSHILTEIVGGDGIVAVFVLGLIFGNAFVKNRGELAEFSDFIIDIFRLFAYVVFGFLLYDFISLYLIFLGLVSFIIYLFVKFIVLYISYRSLGISKKHNNITDILIHALYDFKGIFMVGLIIFLYSIDFRNLDVFVNAGFAFLFFGLISSHISHKFIPKK